MGLSKWSWRDRAAVLAGLVLPFAVCVALVPLRKHVPNTDAALVLVAVVVAVAAFGNRLSGLLASLSAAVWFDFFLTRPYGQFAITKRDDLATALLLLLVGAAVTELAVRGRRYRLRALDDERYLVAIQSTDQLIESKASQFELTSHVAQQLVLLLGLRGCRFEANRFGGLPQLQPDGQIHDTGHGWDIDQRGFPDTEVELLTAVHGRREGRFVLDPTPGVIPSPAARRCAVILCGQVGAALARDQPKAGKQALS